MPETVPSKTRFLPFRARTSFAFETPNASPAASQKGKPGEIYLTNLSPFIRQAVIGNPHFEQGQSTITLKCLPVEQWAGTGFRGKTVLVLLPTQALGDCTQALMALRAFREARQPRKIVVACAGAAYDIFAADPFLTIRPLWFSKREADRADYVLDLGHLLEGQNIDLWPVDFEGALLEALAVPPSSHYPEAAKPLPAGRPLNIGLFPLASSPLRTLPPAAVRHLAAVLSRFGRLTLSLNDGQEQGRLLQRAVEPLDSSITVLSGQTSIGGVLDSIAGLDYAVFADSGPAHMAKLFAIPGVAVYTSAPGDVLQGRFRNLSAYHTEYHGEYCTAPCGLAKVRQTADGEVGCMGSLKRPLSALPKTPQGRNDAAVRQLMAEPVPCVRALAEQCERLGMFVANDIEDRQRRLP